MYYFDEYIKCPRFFFGKIPEFLLKAALVARIIDKEGSMFGQDILIKSKVMQETRKLCSNFVFLQY